jgi:hypothetical protein
VACALAGRGDPSRALCLAGAASGLRGAIKLALQPPEQAALDQYLNAARQALSHEEAEGALSQGRARTVEQAVECALSV